MEHTDKGVTIIDKPIGRWLRSRYILLRLPDHIEPCRDEIKRQITNSLEVIEEKSEIVTGIEQLSKKRRNNSTRIEEARKQCEDFQQEYKKKDDELKSEHAKTLEELESQTSDNDETTPPTSDSDYDHESDYEHDSDYDHESGEFYKQQRELEQEYENKICDYLQEQLNVTSNMRDRSVRDKELGDVVFYYVMRGEEPNKHVQKIIRRLDELLYDHTEGYHHHNNNWYELCSDVLGNTEIFTQFDERLNNNKTSLQYLLYKHPQLLLTEYSDTLMFRLIEHLQYATLHEIITNIRDKKGQTCVVYMNGWSKLMFSKLYRDHIDDFYKLLSIQNSNGQTALHVNPVVIAGLLAEKYTPTQRDSFIKLTSITDNNNKTALQVRDGWRQDELRSLIRRVENNEYIINSQQYTPILIIYNTNNRPGAQEEAETIRSACQSKYDDNNITLEENKTEEEIIDLIKRKAQYLNQSLIVILMSHGSVGTIDDCDGKPIKLSDLEEVMCSHVLNGKPKMLITQCCQDEEQKGNDDVTYQPKHEDFCAVMPCVAGEKSTRGVFLGKLAEQIKNSKSDTNIFKIVNNLSKEMEREGHKQTPIIKSTLKGEFCPTDDWRYSKL